MTLRVNILKNVTIGAFLCSFSGVFATTTNITDQAALQGYVGESVSVSPSFQVNSTVGILNQTIIFDAPTTTPTSSSGGGGGSGSGSGGGSVPSESGTGTGGSTPPTSVPIQRGDTNPTGQGGDDEPFLNSAPKEDDEPFFNSAPKEDMKDIPLLPNENIEPISESEQNSEEVIEETQPIPAKTAPITRIIQTTKPIIPEKEKSLLQEALSGAFILKEARSAKVTFERNSCSKKDEIPSHPLFWHIFPWIIVLILILYGWKKRKEYKKNIDELEEILIKDNQ